MLFKYLHLDWVTAAAIYCAIITAYIIIVLLRLYHSFRRSHAQPQDNEPFKQHPLSKIWNLPIKCPQSKLDELKAHQQYAEVHWKMVGHLVTLDDKINITRHNHDEYHQLIVKHLRNKLYPQYTIYFSFDIGAKRGKGYEIRLGIKCKRDFNLVKQYLIANNNVIKIRKDIEIHMKEHGVF
eukprot:148813_1